MADWRTQGRTRVKEKSDGNTLKLKEGENCIRVLPDKKDLTPDGKLGPKGIQHPPVREFRIHPDVGPDKGQCTCGKSIDGSGECWLCDVKIPDLEKKGKVTQAAAIEAREKFVVQASRYDPDTQKFSIPKPWWVSAGAGIPGKSAANSLAMRVYSKIVSSKKDHIDPNKGYNLNVERTGEGMKTRYPSVEGDESPSKVPIEILKLVKDLDKIIQPYSEDEQKSLYFGRPKQEEDEKPKSRKRVQEVDEDTEEEEESEEVETEETEESEESEEESEETESEMEEDPEEVEETEESEEETEESEEEEEVEEEEEDAPPPPKKTGTKKPLPPPAKKSAPVATKKTGTKKK